MSQSRLQQRLSSRTTGRTEVHVRRDECPTRQPPQEPPERHTLVPSPSGAASFSALPSPPCHHRRTDVRVRADRLLRELPRHGLRHGTNRDARSSVRREHYSPCPVKRSTKTPPLFPWNLERRLFRLPERNVKLRDDSVSRANHL